MNFYSIKIFYIIIQIYIHGYLLTLIFPYKAESIIDKLVKMIIKKLKTKIIIINGNYN